MEDINTAKEIQLKNVKYVLTELSIKFGYDLEPVKELINIKHTHLNGISYPIFKECLYEWLEKQEKKLSTIIFVDDNKLDINGSLNENENDNRNNNYDQNNQNKYEFGTDYDINMIILHRSLYLLKRKFEIHEKEITNIYRRFMEIEKTEFVVDIHNFPEILKSILQDSQLSLAEINKPSELFRVELLNKIKQDKVKPLLHRLNQFMTDNRRKYNNIMKEKKEKGSVDLAGLSINKNKDGNQLANLYEADDEFTKEVKKDIKTDEMLDLIENKVDDDQENENNEKDEGRADVGEIVDGEDEVDKLDIVNENINEDDTNNKKVNAIDNNTSDPNVHNYNNQPITSDDLHPNEITSNENKTIETNQEVIKLRKILDDDIRSFVMDKTTFNKKLKTQNCEDTSKQQSVSASIEDKQFKIIMDKFLSRKQKIPENIIKIEYLLIEILPLIIADFMHENSSVVLVDTNEELKFELRTLFDNEILQRLGELVKYDIDEEKTSKLKDLLFEKLNLDKNIRFYEDLLVKKRVLRENTIFIEKMLKKLKNQKIWIETKIKTLQEDNETVNNHNHLTENKNLSKTNNSVTNIKNQNNSNLIQSNNSSSIDSSIIRKNNISKIIPRKYLTNEEVRSNALKEIFYFYSRQHLAGNKATFDDISNKIDRMDLGEFMKFCVEFKILVKKERLVEVFKKTVSNIKQMTYDEFQLALRSISTRVNDEKKGILMKRINRLRLQLKKFQLDEKIGANDLNMGKEKEKDLEVKESNENEQSTIELVRKNHLLEGDKDNINFNEEEELNLDEKNEKLNMNAIHDESSKLIENAIDSTPVEKIHKNEKNNKLSKNLSLFYSSPQEIYEEISNLKLMLVELKNKTYQQLLEDLFLYLEIDNCKLYRAKMKGFVIAFNSHEKDHFRIPNDVLMKNAKKIDSRTAAEIKKIIKERKEEKEKILKDKEREIKQKFYNQRKKITQINDKIAQEKKKIIIGKESNYASIKNKQEIFEKEKDSKLTWDQLENLDSGFFNSNRNDDFHPEELIVEDEYDSNDEVFFLNLSNKQVDQANKSQSPTIVSAYPIDSKRNNDSNIHNIHTNNLNKSLSKSIEKSSDSDNTGSKIKKDLSPTSKKNYHDHNYFTEKAQKKMKEIEQEWEKKQIKLIEKYDNMIKRSQEKVGKNKYKI